MTIERKPASAKNAEHYLWGDGCDGWHLLNRDDVSVIQERMPLGTSEQMHYHKIARQFFFVLDGRATMDVDGERVVLGKHQGIEIPPGVSHQLRNESSEDLSFLVFSVPKSHKDRYER
jgi:mannose-6-phosphate isomerase-like protein (cupin superfamily)